MYLQVGISPSMAADLVSLQRRVVERESESLSKL